MSRAVGSTSIGGEKGNLLGEFLKIRVRFGEPINAGDASLYRGRTVGFWTLKETAILKRRVDYRHGIEQ